MHFAVSFGKMRGVKSASKGEWCSNFAVSVIGVGLMGDIRHRSVNLGSRHSKMEGLNMLGLALSVLLSQNIAHE